VSCQFAHGGYRNQFDQVLYDHWLQSDSRNS
jgi:hypothetical protein